MYKCITARTALDQENQQHEVSQMYNECINEFLNLWMYKCIKACTAVTKKTNNPRFHTDKIIVIIVNAIQMIQMRMANAL